MSKSDLAARAPMRQGTAHAGAMTTPGASHSGRSHPTHNRRLGAYTSLEGRQREVVVRAGHAGSVLVIDMDSATRRDGRLLAHLAADEPPENAAIVCSDYLRDERVERRRCRLLTREDRRSAPTLSTAAPGKPLSTPSALADRLGCTYRLQLLETGMSIPELRWCRRYGAAPHSRTVVSMREVIASIEDYEPMRQLTSRAVALGTVDGSVSVTVLRAELARVLESPIVLNRGLREAVMQRVGREEISMSEIAMRCGRSKRDSRGNLSGETSWLARRIGLMPEGGQDMPTPWLHSDVLGLIARRGLGVSPREVEL
ncbi:MAG TPA: hypothetical protein VII01_16295 [Solirubrobacteraceae bacterium]|jgi:hypothetical protein